MKPLLSGELKLLKNILQSKITTLHETAILTAASKVTYSHPQPLRRADYNESLHHPLIPDLPIIRLPPNTNLQLGIVRIIEWILY